MMKLKEIGNELEMLGENIDEELKSLGLTADFNIEGDEALYQGKPVDLNNLDLGGCHDSGRGDIIDAALASLTRSLIDKGVRPDRAANAVFDVMADLINRDEIDDSPDIDEPENTKTIWVNNAIPKMRELLNEKGLL